MTPSPILPVLSPDRPAGILIVWSWWLINKDKSRKNKRIQLTKRSLCMMSWVCANEVAGDGLSMSLFDEAGKKSTEASRITVGVIR
jgi:hypothetical protein